MEDKILEIANKYMRKIKETSTGEIIYRCPICGDSSIEHHGHFYVNKETLSYICFKCDTRGKSLAQFILKLFDENPNVEYTKQDKVELIKFSLRNYSPNNILEKSKSDSLLVKSGQNDNVIYNNSDFEKIISKNRTIQEQYIIDTVYIPYYNQRTRGQENVQKDIFNKGLVLFYYSDDVQFIEGYSPKQLLNRLYFKLENGQYSSRLISKYLENNKSDEIIKYIHYMPDTLDSLPPFVLQDQTNNNIHMIYLVEGPFDQIKLYSFLIESGLDGIQILTLNGSNINTYVMNKINNDYNNQYICVYMPDIDVKEEKIINNINRFKSNIYRKSILLSIGKFKTNTHNIKDIGDMIHKEQLSLISIVSQNKYYFNKYYTKLDKIKQFFGGINIR